MIDESFPFNNIVKQTMKYIILISLVLFMTKSFGQCFPVEDLGEEDYLSIKKYILTQIPQEEVDKIIFDVRASKIGDQKYATLAVGPWRISENICHHKKIEIEYANKQWVNSDREISSEYVAYVNRDQSCKEHTKLSDYFIATGVADDVIPIILNDYRAILKQATKIAKKNSQEYYVLTKEDLSLKEIKVSERYETEGAGYILTISSNEACATSVLVKVKYIDDKPIVSLAGYIIV